MQVKPRSLRGLPVAACASNPCQIRPRIFLQRRRCWVLWRVGTTAGRARPEHREWMPAPGVWAGAVSFSWLSLDLPEARAWRAAKKFGNFSSGGLGELSRGCRRRLGQVRSAGWLGTVRCSSQEPLGLRPRSSGHPEMVLSERTTFRVLWPQWVNRGEACGDAWCARGSRAA